MKPTVQDWIDRNNIVDAIQYDWKPNVILKKLVVCYYSDEYFPRLGQLIVDYENPLKKLSEEFTTHQQVNITPDVCDTSL